MQRLPVSVGLEECRRLEGRGRIGPGIEDAWGYMRWVVDIGLEE